MKTFFEAVYHLAFFKPYTIYDRWFEIGCGILFWIGWILIAYINLK